MSWKHKWTVLNHAEKVPVENMLLAPNPQDTLERQVSTRMTTILNIWIDIPFFFFKEETKETKFCFGFYFLMISYQFSKCLRKQSTCTFGALCCNWRVREITLRSWFGKLKGEFILTDSWEVLVRGWSFPILNLINFFFIIYLSGKRLPRLLGCSQSIFWRCFTVWVVRWQCL